MSESKKSVWIFSKLIAILTFVLVSLCGGIPGILSIKNDLFGTSVDIVCRHDPFIGVLISQNKDLFNKPVICFYYLRFVGRGKIPTTIKSISLYVKVKGKWVEGKRIALRTMPVTDKIGNTLPSLVAGNTVDNIFLGEWLNFNEIRDGAYIEIGRTLPFSVAFTFDLSEDDLLRSKDLKLVAIDYFDKKYSSVIDPNKVVSLFDKQLFVFDWSLKDPNFIQEFLKQKYISYGKLQEFIMSKSE